MINPFYYYPRLQKKFNFQTNLESIILLCGGVLLSLLEMLSMMAIFPLMMIVLDPVSVIHGRIIGRLYAWSHLSSLYSFSLLLVGIVITAFGLKAGFHLSLWRYEFKLLSKWRIKISSLLFNALLYTNFQNIQKDSSSKLINIITSITPYVVTNYIYQCIHLAQTLFLSIFIFIYMAWFNFYLFAFTLIFGLITVSSFLIIQKNKIKRLGKQSQILSRKMLETMQQSIAGLKETKIHQKEAFFLENFKDVSKKMTDVDCSLLFTQNLPSLLVEFICISVIFITFTFLLLLMNNLQTSAIQISMVVIMGMRIIPLINRSIVSLSLIRSSIEPIKQLMKAHESLLAEQHSEIPQQKNESFSFEKSISLKSLSFKYQTNGPDILKNIALHIQKGDHIGIVGPSGSGKSTLAHIILGFLTKYKGDYYIDEQKINDENLHSARQLLSYVDQQPFLLDNTIMSNIAYGVAPDKIDKNQIIDILKDVGLWEHIRMLDKGIATPIGENGKFLSGGQRQRIAIARALYKKANILILDEASSALDMDSEVMFIKFLETLREKMTIISIAHRLSTLKNCNRIVFIQNGEITSQGTFQELYAEVATFKRYIDHTVIKVS